MDAHYGRQSIDKKDSISIETQLEYCKNESFNQAFRVYKDKGYSGKDTNRPAFNQMIKDIKSGQVNRVIVYRIDRLSRSLLDFADFMELLNKYSVSFVSATEKFDTSSPIGKAMLFIVMVFAQLERETISERVKDNYYARVRSGAWGGGPAPYGFKLKRLENKTVLDPDDNIEVVKRIFELYSQQSNTLSDVQKALIADNISSTRSTWDTSSISKLLHSPAYVRSDASIYNYYKSKGCIMVNDIEEYTGNGLQLAGKREASSRKYSDVKNHVVALSSHEGIVDSNVFIYCLNKLSGNKQLKNSGKGTRSWLTGLTKCGHCGYSITTKAGRVKHGYEYYFVCSGKYTKKICDDLNTTLRVSDVENFVESAILNEMRSVDTNVENKTDKTKLNKLNMQLLDIEAKINNLVDQLSEAPAASSKYILTRIEQLDIEKNSIMNTLVELEFEKSGLFTFDVNEWNGFSFDDKKEVARSMINTIKITNDDIVIDWKR